MPAIETAPISQAFTADGLASGIAAVASTAGIYVGTIGYLSATGLPGQRCIVVSVVDATHVGVRIIADDNENQLAIQVYGGTSSLVAYTLAGGAKLSIPSQIARVEGVYGQPQGRLV